MRTELPAYLVWQRTEGLDAPFAADESTGLTYREFSQLTQAYAEVFAANGVGVGDVVAAVEIAEGFVLVRNVATGVALVLVGILLVVSLFIIANTIKLATFYRRDEIAIMKMCGATDGFIRWPFVVEGLVLGLTGSLVAFFLQWGLYQMVGSVIIQGNGLSLVTMIPYTAMVSTILPVFCAVGAVIGVGGSLVAIRKFLQV